MVQRLPESVPEVGGLDPQQRVLMEKNLREAMETVCEHLLGGAARFDYAYRAGERRAEAGFPFKAMVSMVLETSRVFNEEILAETRDADPQLQTVLNDRLFTAMNTGIANLLAGYHQASVTRVQHDYEHHTALVDTLLAGRGRAPAAHGTVAESLGLPLCGTLRVLVCERRNGGDSPVSDMRHRPNDPVRMVRRLNPGEEIAVVALPGPDPRILQGVLERCGTARTGVSAEYTDVDDTAEALRQARRALAGLAGTDRRVANYGDDPFALLILAAPTEARRVVRTRLGPILALPTADRDMLVDTLRAWFTAHGSTPQTAKALRRHRNTVRLRLLRIQELTGIDITDPTAATDLRAALRALDLLPDLIRPPDASIPGPGR
ncbi:PucR family transcriptional regulator [Nocardia transvalensis]|uniref:PucR family transcriptional regulator n=1 Tax=Nocardia transvalensis TaxID=37333 RepID=UPI00189376E6|nr:helix-turn-helix domain-containing protein [Nocardia transvalensis]MBF6330285.1 helix-turn-helix domain-containing protein [Nocardia transvalensis]